MGILGDGPTDDEKGAMEAYEAVTEDELLEDHAAAVAGIRCGIAANRAAVIANCEELNAVEAEQHEE